MGNYFVAVKIPLKVSKRIFEKLKEKNLLKFIQGKYVPFENYHFTLRFFGELEKNEVEEIVENLKKVNFDEFRCTLNEFGVFDNKNIGVIWFGCSSFELNGLVGEIWKKVGSEKRKFKAHSTVIRFRKILDRESLFENLKKLNLKEIDFEISEFYLMKSELLASGAKYHIVESFGLGVRGWD